MVIAGKCGQRALPSGNGLAGKADISVVTRDRLDQLRVRAERS